MHIRQATRHPRVETGTWQWRARAMILGATLAIATPISAADEGWTILQARGNRLYAGDEEFRFISFNIPNLHNVEDAFEFNAPNPWRWPDEFEIEDALESVRQAGGTVARTYVLSVFRAGADAGRHVHVLSPGEFNEEAFRVLDKVLQIAAEKRIRILVPLVDNWHWWGGAEQYAAFRDKPARDFWTDPEVIADFKQTIDFVVNRRNTHTGIVYRDDPTIFGWETGNEIDSPPEWTRQIAAYSKELDPQHLVIDGNTLHGIRQSSLDDPNVDVVCTHHYPDPRSDMVDAVRRAIRDVDGRKPYFVGEFGFVPIATVRELLDVVSESETVGALLWSLRFHRREGGFYWHSEPAGGGIYKAYHWPGFDSGEAYEERQVLDLVRAKAYQIRGLAPPEVMPPQVPHLLPVDDSAHISWQGSAGADRYDLERATTPEGPWKIVGSDLSDAESFYRPLFCDHDIELNQPYYYRVIAKNDAGASGPSNVVGPVSNSVFTLVDEFEDLSQIDDTSDGVEIVRAQARRTQEDAHRLVGPGEAAVTIHLAGPIQGWTVWVFAEQEAGKMRVLGSGDGKSFTPLDWSESVTRYATNDYGYLQPRRYWGEVTDPTPVRWLRLEFPDAAGENDTESAGIELARMEITYLKQ